MGIWDAPPGSPVDPGYPPGYDPSLADPLTAALMAQRAAALSSQAADYTPMGNAPLTGTGARLADYLGEKGKGLLDSLGNAASLPGRALYGPESAGFQQYGAATPEQAVNAASWITMPSLGRGALAGMPENVLSMSGAADKPAGFTAYHGSPHDFERFDISKIGTGEGAQAYGHGLYFAGNENVARSYRDTLSQSHISHPTLGDNLPLATVDDAIANAAERVSPGLGPSKHAMIGANVTEAIKNGDNFDDFRKFVAKSDWSDAEKSAWNAALDKGQEFTKSGSAGRMYQVQINADPEHFLDWDKPLSEQHPKVQEALKLPPVAQRLNDKMIANGNPGMTAGNAYTEIRAAVPGMDAATLSQKLRDAGIPGIKYLDQGSRGAGGEGATHNYVTFSDDIINILKKYGLAGLGLAGYGASQSQGNQANQ